MKRGAPSGKSIVWSLKCEKTWRTRPGSRNGKPLRNRSLISEKIAVFSPIPRVRVSTARSVNPGDFRNCRSANRRSVIIRVQGLSVYGAARIGCIKWGRWIQIRNAARGPVCLSCARHLVFVCGLSSEPFLESIVRPHVKFFLPLLFAPTLLFADGLTDVRAALQKLQSDQ